MLLTALPPALTADILVIPDLEEVQEEDFVLQVAAPPRYVTLGVKLQGGRGQVASHTPVPAPVLLPPVQTHMLLVTAPRPPPPPGSQFIRHVLPVLGLPRLPRRLWGRWPSSTPGTGPACGSSSHSIRPAASR